MMNEDTTINNVEEAVQEAKPLLHNLPTQLTTKVRVKV